MSIFAAAFGTGAAVPPGVLGRGAETGARGDAKKSEVFFAERNKRFIFAVLFRHGAGRRESKFIERLEDKKSTSKYRF